MDVVNISRSRRFLRERPMHVNLFDRPRLVVDLLCLEANQEESRTGFEKSDSLLVLLEGEARLRAGPQIESLQEMDAVLVPPGQEYTLANTGAGQMMALVMLTPKPTRADEVRVPGDQRPFRRVRMDEDEGQSRPPMRSSFTQNGGGETSSGDRPRRGPSYAGRDNGQRSAYPRRDDNAPRGGYPRRDDQGERSAYPRRDDSAPRGGYPRRDDQGERGAYPRRDDSAPRGGYPRRDDQRATRRGYPRRDDQGERGAYPRRDDSAPRSGYPRRNAPGGRPAYPRRDGAPSGPRGNNGGGFDRGRPPRRDASSDDQSGPRRGTTGARSPRRGEGEGPVWYPKPKPAWRPFGAPPAAQGRGKPGQNRDQGEGRRGSYGGNGAPRGASGGAGGRSGGYEARGGSGPRGRSGGFDRSAAPRGGGNGRKTGDARRASRGQGPLTGHRGPGRSEPRT